jgi:hypothetical protein
LLCFVRSQVVIFDIVECGMRIWYDFLGMFDTCYKCLWLIV